MRSTLELAGVGFMALMVLWQPWSHVLAYPHNHDHQGSSSAHQHQSEAGNSQSSFLANALSSELADEHVNYIDLSHPLHNGTLHWPRNKGIQVFMDLDLEASDPRGNKYHVRSDSVNMSIHVGTHLDAPSHFAKDAWTVEKIPLNRLIDVPLTVIDLSEKVKNNRSYSFLKSDFIKDNKPLVGPNSVVLVYTGISELYDDNYKGYVGTEKNTSISMMKSPGFSLEAAQYLVELKVFGVGLDAISADSSDRQADENRYDPQAHIAFNTNNVYILENVSKSLKQLIGVSSARLTISPLPVVGGTGSPVRLVAMVGHGECHNKMANGASSQSGSLQLSVLIALFICILVNIL